MEKEKKMLVTVQSSSQDYNQISTFKEIVLSKMKKLQLTN